MGIGNDEVMGLLRSFESRSRALWTKHGDRKKRAPGLAGFRGFGDEVEQLMRFAEFVDQRLAESRIERKADRQKSCSAIRWQTLLLRLHFAHDYFGAMASGRRPQAVGVEAVASREIEHLDRLEAYFRERGGPDELRPLNPEMVAKVRAMIDKLCARSLALLDLTDSASFADGLRSFDEDERDDEPAAPAAPRAPPPKREKKRSEMTDAEKRVNRIKLPSEFRDGHRFLARNALEVITQARQKVGLSGPELARKVGVPDTQLALMIGGHDPIAQGIIERIEAVLSGLEAHAFVSAQGKSDPGRS
jgi:hypothetical protein